MPTSRVPRLAAASALLVAACQSTQTSGTPADSSAGPTRSTTGNGRDSVIADTTVRRDTTTTPGAPTTRGRTTPPPAHR